MSSRICINKKIQWLHPYAIIEVLFILSNKYIFVKITSKNKNNFKMNKYFKTTHYKKVKKYKRAELIHNY